MHRSEARQGSFATEPPASNDDLPGRVIAGRYLVGELLGAGAMGLVYEAQHLELGRPCAVKIIRPSSEVDSRELSEAVTRFRLEALAASRLDHPNVLRVLDFGRDADDGLFYLVVEHLKGEDLIDVLGAQRTLPTERIVAIARQICAGLQHAHERGVVHRDIKPENVRLVARLGDDGCVHEQVKLLDFGTAEILPNGADPGASEQATVIGTPAYMSPEQAMGRPVDARSDVYSCGVMLFEMATGRLPFVHASPVATAAAQIECRPPSPSAVDAAVDPLLESIILWCMQKKPEDRPQSARELRAALDRVLAQAHARRRADLAADSVRAAVQSSRRRPELHAPSPSTRRRPEDVPAPRRSGRLAAALVVGGAVVLLGGTWLYLLWPSAAPAPLRNAAAPAAPVTPTTADAPAERGRPPDEAAEGALAGADRDTSRAPAARSSSPGTDLPDTDLPEENAADQPPAAPERRAVRALQPVRNRPAPPAARASATASPQAAEQPPPAVDDPMSMSGEDLAAARARALGQK